jgi:hypothetical protein
MPTIQNTKQSYPPPRVEIEPRGQFTLARKGERGWLLGTYGGQVYCDSFPIIGWNGSRDPSTAITKYGPLDTIEYWGKDGPMFWVYAVALDDGTLLTHKDQRYWSLLHLKEMVRQTGYACIEAADLPPPIPPAPRHPLPRYPSSGPRPGWLDGK